MSSDPVHTGGTGFSYVSSQPYIPAARQHPFAPPGAPGTPQHLGQQNSFALGSNVSSMKRGLGSGADMSGIMMGGGADPLALGGGSQGREGEMGGGLRPGFSPAVGPGTPVSSSNGSYNHLNSNGNSNNTHQHQPSPPSYLASPAASPSPHPTPPLHHPYTPPPPRYSSHQAGGSLVRHGSLLMEPNSRSGGAGPVPGAGQSRGMGGYGTPLLPGGISPAAGSTCSRGGGWGEGQRTPTRHTIHSPLLSAGGGSGSIWGWGGGGADTSPAGPGSPGNISSGWGAGGGGGGARRGLSPALNNPSLLGDGGGSGMMFMSPGSPRHLGGGGGGGYPGGGGARGSQGGFSVYDMKVRQTCMRYDLR
jgi:hypothetical protein